MIGYCFKCRIETEMDPREGEPEPKKVWMKNGKPATEGACPACGTNMYRLGHEVEPVAAG